MTRMIWDAPGERTFQTGVDRGVLYVEATDGVPWNGLVSVNEEPVGGSPKAFYVDGVKYLNQAGPEEFEATLEAYTYPLEFEICDGTSFDANGVGYGQQARSSFGLSYRSKVGNDIEGPDFGYQIHMVYNALATPSTKAHGTLSDTLDATTFSWKMSTTPIRIPGLRPTSHIFFDTRRVVRGAIERLEDWLYGNTGSDPFLPSATQLNELFQEYGLKILSNPLTGMTQLVQDENPDIIGNPTFGLYSRHPDSRLVGSDVTGLYTLEE